MRQWLAGRVSHSIGAWANGDSSAQRGTHDLLESIRTQSSFRKVVTARQSSKALRIGNIDSHSSESCIVQSRPSISRNTATSSHHSAPSAASASTSARYAVPEVRRHRRRIDDRRPTFHGAELPKRGAAAQPGRGPLSRIDAALDDAKTRLAALKKYDRQYRQTQEACVLVVVRSGFDLHRHHLTRPAVLERLGGIPDSLLWILDLVKQGTEMEPW